MLICERKFLLWIHEKLPRKSNLIKNMPKMSNLKTVESDKKYVKTDERTDFSEIMRTSLDLSE